MGSRALRSQGEDETVMFPPPYCPRCRGLMYSVSYGHWGHPQDAQTGRAWNCIHCGEMIDPVIVANRRLHEPEATRKCRARLSGSDTKP